MIDVDTITLADLEADPHPILAQLRETAPACYVPSIEMWLVTRWEDVIYVCEHPELFSANTDPSWLRECLGENMLTLDGQAHDRLANGMRPPFAGTATGRVMAESLPGMFDGIIDGFIDQGSADLMPAYAEPLANLTLLHALGLTSVTWEELAGWCNGVITGLANFENDPEKSETAAAAHAELGEALEKQLAAVDASPDGLGLAAYQEAGFDHEEIINNVRLMISGGINEPRDAVGLVMYELLRDPVLLARAKADQKTLRKTVEETFRFHSPVGTATRQTTAAVEIGGVTIPEGSMVGAVLTAANRDPERWSEPDEFRVDRGEGPHLAFAIGEHRCLGEWMARQQVRTGVSRLLDRLPEIRLDGEVELHGFEFRGPVALPVTWSNQ
ncbi:MAG: cytochrome P450 [Acidimicrobiia bacterium]